MENVGAHILEDRPAPSEERVRKGRALLQTTHDDLSSR